MPIINAHLFYPPKPGEAPRLMANEPRRRMRYVKAKFARQIDDPDYWLDPEAYYRKHGHYPPGEGWPGKVSAARKAEQKREAAQRYRDRKARAGDA